MQFKLYKSNFVTGFAFWLPVWDDEVLGTPKITTFLAKPLPKLYEPFQSNAIPWPL